MANLHRIEASYLDSHETALGPGKGSHATRALLEHFWALNDLFSHWPTTMIDPGGVRVKIVSHLEESIFSASWVGMGGRN
jgi:hypothetical protein